METTEGKKCKLIADVAVFSKEEVLLVRYADTNKYDHQQGWFLPDDLVNYLEHPEDAALRILNDQLGLTESEITLNHVESFKGNDGTWHIAFHYRTNIENGLEVKPSRDIHSYKFFHLDELPPKNEVAHHGWALYTINDMKI